MGTRYIPQTAGKGLENTNNSQSVFQKVVVHITPNELVDIVNTPIVLVIPNGSNQIINPLFFGMEFVFGTIVYMGNVGIPFLSWDGSHSISISSDSNSLNEPSSWFFPSYPVGGNGGNVPLDDPGDFAGRSILFSFDGINPDIGGVSTLAIENGGTDWGAGQIVVITGGDGNALAIVNTVDGLGTVTQISIIGGPGTGYDVNNNPHTTTGDGNITTVIINSGGLGYAIGDTGGIDAGNGNATFIVTGIQGTFPIVGIDQGLKKFIVTGDATGILSPTNTFTVIGSTGNDGTYTVDSLFFSGGTGRTVIIVLEAIPDPTEDGHIDTSGGSVESITITNSGTGYSGSSGVPTKNPSGGGGALTLDITVGSGLTLNITNVITGDGDLYVTLVYEIVDLH